MSRGRVWQEGREREGGGGGGGALGDSLHFANMSSGIQYQCW